MARTSVFALCVRLLVVIQTIDHVSLATSPSTPTSSRTTSNTSQGVTSSSGQASFGSSQVTVTPRSGQASSGTTSNSSEGVMTRLGQACSDVDVTIEDTTRNGSKKLQELLSKKGGTLRLIFIYFDLELGDKSYHPGSCPYNGNTPADVQTPLVWVLHPLAEADRIFRGHSVPRAYLTLPVSHPRIYSSGLLDNRYVEYLNHKTYQMKLVVKDSNTSEIESCWLSFDVDAKAKRVRDKLNKFLMIDDSSAHWHTCYSKPVWHSEVEDLGFSASMLNPHTAAYRCFGNDREFHTLKRDRSLDLLQACLVLLGLFLVILQAYGILTVVDALYAWGREDQSKEDDEKNIKLPEYYFTEDQLPPRLTIGGLLRDDNMLGFRAFDRLKFFLAALAFAALYFVAPIWWMRVTWNAENSEDTDGRLQEPDTFEGCHFEKKKGFQVFAASMVVFWVCFLSYAVVIWGCGGEKKLTDLREGAKQPVRWSFSLSMFAICYLRWFMSFPIEIPSLDRIKKKCKSCSCPADCVALFFATILWLIGFVLSPILIFVLFGIEFVKALSAFPYPWFLLLPIEGKKKGIAQVAAAMVTWFGMIFCYAVGEEILAYTLFTFIGIFLKYPTQTFMVATWLVTLLAQTKKAVSQFRGPLLKVWKIYTTKFQKVVQEKGLQETQAPEKLMEDTSLCLKAMENQTGGERIDWCEFEKEAQVVLDEACYQLLSRKCPNTPYAQAKSKPPTSDQKCGPKAGSGSSTSNPTHGRQAGSESSTSDYDPKRDDDLALTLVNLLTLKKRQKKSKEEKREEKRRETDREKVRELVQHCLRVTFFHEMGKLFVYGVIAATIFTVLLAFNELWTSSKDLNSLFFNLALIPLVTWIQVNVSSHDLNGHDAVLVEHIIKVGIDNALKKATKAVSPGNVSEVEGRPKGGDQAPRQFPSPSTSERDPEQSGCCDPFTGLDEAYELHWSQKWLYESCVCNCILKTLMCCCCCCCCEEFFKKVVAWSLPLQWPNTEETEEKTADKKHTPPAPPDSTIVMTNVVADAGEVFLKRAE